MLQAPCMLTHLNSLSLDRIAGSTKRISGSSLLTNLCSFSWTGHLRALPQGVIASVPSLKCLTVAGAHPSPPDTCPYGGLATPVKQIWQSHSSH